MVKVIKIGAQWCPGCIVMRPRWQQIQSEPEFVDVPTKYYDYDDNPEELAQLTEKYPEVSLENLPVFLFLDEQDNLVEKLVGEPTVDQIRTTLRKYL